MNSTQISQMYRDHFKYNFGDRELYQLLGEGQGSSQITNIPETVQQRKYFLKFTSIQIDNVDCQSGLLTDVQPISIPLSKMVNLFFLSKDQL